MKKNEILHVFSYKRGFFAQKENPDMDEKSSRYLNPQSLVRACKGKFYFSGIKNLNDVLGNFWQQELLARFKKDLESIFRTFPMLFLINKTR